MHTEEEDELQQGAATAPLPPLESSNYWPSSSSSEEVAAAAEDDGPRRRLESMVVNRLISTVYSGPTISDIESALSFSGGDHLLAAPPAVMDSTSISPVYVYACVLLVNNNVGEVIRR
jgi:hypothetical protein